MNVDEQVFETRDAAADAVAGAIAGRIRATLAADARAAIVVSGGSTPAPVFRRLAATELDWPNVTVLPSDERWVPPAHDDSNEKLLRGTLLTGRAAQAGLVSFYRSGSDPGGACADLEREWSRLPLPFAATLLGMGGDGHFASLFPDDPGLAPALDIGRGRYFVPVSTAASPHARISLTLAALVRSREVILFFTGDGKRAVYERARAGDRDLPVSTLLRDCPVPLTVAWAP